jgi:tRNA1(Val) A37 N6-methylase TrmN6
MPAPQKRRDLVTKYTANREEFREHVQREVFRSGGFDAVVGNPPYFSIDKTWGRATVASGR